MAENNRRDFLRKMLMGGLAFSGSSSFVLGNESEESSSDQLKNANWKKIRKQFLIDKKVIFLNSGSHGPAFRASLQTLQKKNEQLANTYQLNLRRNNLVNDQFAQFLKVDKDEIAITRNATEGMNIIARSLQLKEGDEVILTSHEHVGGATPWLMLAKEIGIKIRIAELDLSGKKNLDILCSHVNDRTKVMCFSHVTCTTGMILPAKELAHYCKKNNIICCIDGAQSLGMIPVNLKEINPDFYAASGHKWMFGPVETGVLFINKDIISSISPVFSGAYVDESYNLKSQSLEYRQSALRVEYGTRNKATKAGLAKSLELISNIGIDRVSDRGKELATYTIDQLNTLDGIEILTPSDQEYRGAIVTFRHNTIPAKEIKKVLHKRQITVRLVYENELNAMRLSLAIFNSKKEIDTTISLIKGLTGPKS